MDAWSSVRKYVDANGEVKCDDLFGMQDKKKEKKVGEEDMDEGKRKKRKKRSKL